MSRIRLGVNIDHVATVRNARGGEHPDPLRAALIVERAGGDGITAHIREDRRHIRDDDIVRLAKECSLPLNMEMAANDEMVEIALEAKPNACCIVPENREEKTTEAGLDVIANAVQLKPIIDRLNGAGIRVSLFIDPDIAQLEKASALNAPVVELHTGSYAETSEGEARDRETERLRQAARHCEEIGLECHMGHGLTYENVSPIAAIANVRELNIGHFLVGEAIFCGFEASIRRMRQLIDQACPS